MKMVPFRGFVGGSYRSRSSFVDAQRTINMYPEMTKSGTAKVIAALYGCPGTRLWQNFPGGAIRGMIRFTAGISVIVSGEFVYTHTHPGGITTLCGSIDFATTPVGIASNGTTVMIVTGPNGYVLNPNTGVLTQIVDVDFLGADSVGFIDGFFAFNKPGTGQFQITKIYSTDIEGLDFATAEGAPDLLLSLLIDHREIWLFGETSTEVFFNSGNVDFPFERIQGAFIEQGCAAKFSPAKMDNTVYWLTADERGFGMVQRAVGYQPQRISTHEMEQVIQKYDTISDAIGYTYQQEGHSFYVLTFPSANATWCFDAASGEWHERAWRNPADASLNRHRSMSQMVFAGKVLVGDFENGNVYIFDLDYYSDNGDTLPAIRQTPYVTNPSDDWVIFDKLYVEMEVGVGLISGQGVDPVAMLVWSDDDGKTWSNEREAHMGRMGNYRTRVNFRRLGKARRRIFRVTVTDPVKRVFVDAKLGLRVL